MAKNNYDSMAGYYDLWASYEAPHVAAGIETLDLAKGETVLELGCGTGKAALRLAAAVQPNGKYIGLDISNAMLAKARKRLTAAGLSSVVSLRAADATQPFPPLEPDHGMEEGPEV